MANITQTVIGGDNCKVTQYLGNIEPEKEKRELSFFQRIYVKIKLWKTSALRMKFREAVKKARMEGFRNGFEKGFEQGKKQKNYIR